MDNASPAFKKAVEMMKLHPKDVLTRKYLGKKNEVNAVKSQRWEPQDGPQYEFVHSTVPDAFFGGGRGSGKTVSLILAFQEYDQAWDRHAIGIIFRKSHPELEEVQRLAREILQPAGWTYRAGERMWVSPQGGTLKLRHIENEADSTLYQGHSYTWLAVDEIGNYPTLDYLDKLRATLRGGKDGQPKYFRCTGNPGGVGHMHLKARYVDPAEYGTVFVGEDGVSRCYYHSTIQNNPMLLDNDPEYIDRIKASGQEWLVRAWLEGDWNVVAGSYLEGIWDPARHVIPPFDIPTHWRRFRSLDWGFASPFSVGWWAIDHDGVLYRYRELYGDGKGVNKGLRLEPAEVSRRILEAEAAERAQGVRFVKNPADTGIWTNTGQNFMSIAEQFRQEGVVWHRAAKGPGSRVNGAQEIVGRLASDRMKVFNTCKYAIKFLPSMIPDADHPEDVDSSGEDHCVTARTALRFSKDGTKIWTQGRWRRFRNVRRIAKDVPIVRLTFSDGFQVSCTPNHMFLTDSGWFQAGEMEGRTLPLSPTPSSDSTVLPIIEAVNTSSGPTVTGRAYASIRQYGLRILEKYQKAIISITETMTGITMRLQISSAYQGADTACTITRSEPQRRPEAGTLQTRATRGINSTTRTTSALKLRRRLRSVVRSVETRIRLRRFFSTAQSTAAESVRNVRCVSVERRPNEDVYCLRVPSCATFDLENGVVSQNCWDEIMYAVLSRRSKTEDIRRETRTKPGSFNWLTEVSPDPMRKPKREIWQLGGTR